MRCAWVNQTLSCCPALRDLARAYSRVESTGPARATLTRLVWVQTNGNATRRNPLEALDPLSMARVARIELPGQGHSALGAAAPVWFVDSIYLDVYQVVIQMTIANVNYRHFGLLAAAQHSVHLVHLDQMIWFVRNVHVLTQCNTGNVA